MKSSKLKRSVEKAIMLFCEKCGWQTQKSKMTEKLKEHCKDCKCQEKEQR